MNTHYINLNSTVMENCYTPPIPVAGYTTMTASMKALTVAWSACVVTVQRSNDGVLWASLASPVTFIASAMTEKIDVRGLSYIRFIVTTANGSDGYGILNYTLSNEPSDILASGSDSTNRKISAVGCCFNGGTTTPALGSVEVSVPFSGTITKARIIANASGSAVVDVLKSTYSGYGTVASIAASAKPTLSSVIKNEDSTLTGWTTAVTAGDIVRFTLESVTTCTRVEVSLEVLRT